MAEKDKTNRAGKTAEAAAPTGAKAAADTGAKKHEGKAAKPKADTAKVSALEEKLAGAEQKQAELQESLLRTAAEYENYRKRSQKEHDAAFSNGVAHAAEQLLPVLDTLEAAANAETTDAEYKKGVMMILAKAEEIFNKLGITEIAAQDQPFDPEFHNACMQEACEGTESGMVTKVIQKGYMLNGRVIRHAMVAVSG